jgi:integrase
MIARGISAKVIQETPGHASFTMTMDVYGHLLEGPKRDVADQMGDFLEGR